MLGSRIASGAALAGLPLALALTAAAQSWPCWIVTLGGVLVGVVIGLTIAPWVPLLHKIPPPLGAPKVEITIRQVPQGEHRYPDTSLILEVGVKPTTRLDDAVVNFTFPRDRVSHTGLRALNAHGDELPQGSILPPRHLDSNSPILWWEASADLKPASTMFWFQLIPINSKQAQTFKVTMLVSSEKLHGREHQADYEVSYSPPPQELSSERDGA